MAVARAQGLGLGWATVVLGLMLGACAQGKNGDEFAGLGRRDASSAPPAGVYLPISDGDLGAVQERGVLLYGMERALRLGYERGAYAVGVAEGDVILPLVDVDPGGRSAQILFLRWGRDRVGVSGNLHPKWAERWLLVSVMLEPERIIDKELLAGDVQENSVEYHRAAAILSAAQSLREQTPEQAYHLFTVPEVVPTGNKRNPSKIATRVYALSATGSGPDIEVLVDQPKKSRIPEVLGSDVVHEAGTADATPLSVRSAQPAPATVARAMLQGAAGNVEVESSAGLWMVSGRTGRVSRP